MHIEFFLEEESAEVALKVLLPKIIPENVSRHFYVFRSKQDLLENLSVRLNGRRLWIPDDWRIMVLVDEDRDNCHQLKAMLEEAAEAAGLATKSGATPQHEFQVVNRLAVEELEAWYFGDPMAVREAYPRVSKSFEYQAKYRNPDAIRGGTSEALQFLLKRYYTNRLPKIEVARKIATHMDPNRNKSRSFQVFVEGLKACVGESEFRI